jgi:hypothetical protein
VAVRFAFSSTLAGQVRTRPAEGLEIAARLTLPMKLLMLVRVRVTVLFGPTRTVRLAGLGVMVKSGVVGALTA